MEIYNERGTRNNKRLVITVYNRFHRLLMSHNSTRVTSADEVRFGNGKFKGPGLGGVYILLNHGGSWIFREEEGCFCAWKSGGENEGIEGLVKNFILKIEEGGAT